MLKRKFQIFISSTFEDMREERQAAVEAVLRAGHIPAGMELFTAGSESQLAVIRSWIRDSDIYVLILGGRYGSIEPKSGLSYTEVEFDFAREQGKPFFSIILSDEGREVKVKAHGTTVLERANVPKYDLFKTKVSSLQCSFFGNAKDVKLAIFENLPQMTTTEGLSGWVPASEIGPSNELAAELAKVLDANRTLAAKVHDLELKLVNTTKEISHFEKLRVALQDHKITVPGDLNETKKNVEGSVFDVALFFTDTLAVGVSNSAGASLVERFLRFSVAPALVSYGLAEQAKVSSRVPWIRILLSKEGIKFFTWARLNRKNDMIKSSTGPPLATSTMSKAQDTPKKVAKKIVK